MKLQLFLAPRLNKRKSRFNGAGALRRLHGYFFVVARRIQAPEFFLRTILRNRGSLGIIIPRNLKPLQIVSGERREEALPCFSPWAGLKQREHVVIPYLLGGPEEEQPGVGYHNGNDHEGERRLHEADEAYLEPPCFRDSHGDHICRGPDDGSVSTKTGP